MKLNNIPLWLLALAFGAPFVAGWLLFLNPELLPRGGGGANHGELIQPARPAGDITVEDRQGRPLALADMRGKWVLLLVSDRCERSCPEMLWKMRQVRLALGTGRDRVERLLLLREAPSAELDGLLAEAFPRMPVARLGTGSGPTADLLPADSAKEALFVIDPMGNLMMRYPSAARAEDILDDMERLLKVSEHWGTP